MTWVFRTFYSNYKLQIPKELTKKISQIYEDCKSLRQNRPHVFCGFVASILFLIAIIGHVVSGTYILLGKWPWISYIRLKTITFIFTLASLVCLIAAVLVTSKYEIRLIKENGKTCSASCFSYLIFVDCGSWRNKLIPVDICLSSEWKKRQGRLLAGELVSYHNVRFSSNFYFLSHVGYLRFVLSQQRRRKC